MNNWQPIETAPKDGTYVDIYAGERFPACKWEKGRWVFWGTDDFGSPGWEKIGWVETHWMPIPPPPLPNDEDERPGPTT